MALEAGLTAAFDHVVGSEHTAIARGSGDVEVLATPQVLAWCEGASAAAVSPALDAGETSVGMRIKFDHLRATPVGATVSVHAELTRVEGRRLTFDVVATDGAGEIATGQIVRVVVDRARFMERAQG